MITNSKINTGKSKSMSKKRLRSIFNHLDYGLQDYNAAFKPFKKHTGPTDWEKSRNLSR